jgi:hypothetical protein
MYDFLEIQLFNFSFDKTDKFFHLSLLSISTEKFERCLFKIERDFPLLKIDFMFLHIKGE